MLLIFSKKVSRGDATAQRIPEYIAIAASPRRCEKIKQIHCQVIANPVWFVAPGIRWVHSYTAF